jgi:septal ring factor EnvC (AmiA/AmiB activator)
MNPRLVSLALWALAVVASSRAAPAEPHPLQGDLDALGRRLVREQRLLETLQEESRSLLGTLDGLEAEWGQAQAALEEAGQRQARLEVELADLQAGQAEAEQGAARTRARLRVRLRRLYMLGEVGWLNLVFAAESPRQALERFQAVERLARADAGLIEELGQHEARLKDSQRELDAQRRRIEALAAEVRERQRRAAQARAEKLRALELVGQRQALHARAARELRQARKRLGSLVAAIEGASEVQVEARGFATWKGRLPPPVRGARIEAAFGRQVDERFQTVTLHTGLDLRAPRGTPVTAIYPGRVAFADLFEGYGRLVILDHGGGYFSLAAHLDSFAVQKGDRVAQGQPLGALGDSGSLKGPFLYFEIREGGRAVDPRAWLRWEAR